jgi:hypothetical protein
MYNTMFTYNYGSLNTLVDLWLQIETTIGWDDLIYNLEHDEHRHMDWYLNARQ